MLFKNISLLDEELNIKENMNLFVNEAEGIIEKIFPGNEEKKTEKFIYRNYGERVYDGRGKFLIPGFVNSHAHSPMTLLRGYGENLPLLPWLEEKIFPFESKLTGEAVYWATMLAMGESLRFGITSTTDMYYFSENMVEAVKDSKCKNNISRAVTNFTGEDPEQLKSFEEMKDLYRKHHREGSDKIKVDFSIHAEYTSNLETVKKIAEYNEKIGTRIHIHLSETEREHTECIKKYGKTPAAYFDSLGLFNAPATAAHCVWVTEEDMDILKKKNVTVACNPVSNMKLASGVCNVPMLLEKGINVAIGTDSVASNNSLNFIEEMKFFALASKMYYNRPEAVTPKETLYAATRGGALSQGRNDTGLIKEGFKADITLVDITGPHMQPCHDLLTNLVYSGSGSDVVMTMVDGRILYEDGEWFSMDMETVKNKVEYYKNKIVQKL